MANLVESLVEAGVHFGHRSSRWNPKMRPYIYGRRNLIHVIDVRETIRGLLRARKYLQQVSTGGSLVRPSDGRQPQKVAWIQCAGSRGMNRGDVPYCSGVCCMYALKEAIVTKERFEGDIDATIFYMETPELAQNVVKALRAENIGAGILYAPDFVVNAGGSGFYRVGHIVGGSNRLLTHHGDDLAGT